MRISTPLLYQQAVSAITDQQSQLLHLQQQIASGRRMLTASDDPVAAAQALVVHQSKAETDRFGDNIGNARDLLGQNDSLLGSISEVLQSVRTTAINAGSGTVNASDRAALSSEVASRLAELIGLANSRDSNGNFMYAGFQNSAPPFTGGAGSPVVYGGDQGMSSVQVSPTRNINVTQTGSALFETIRNGNGTFVTTPAAANTGTGVVGSTAVANAASLTGDTYALQFNVSGSTTTYDIVDVTSSTTLSSGNAYTAGAPITLAGMTVSLTGAPATGDKFTLAPSTSQSVFTTLQKLITVLQSPTATDTQRANLTNGLNEALQNIDHSLETVLTARSEVGANLRELDGLGSGNEDRSVQYQQTLSRLEDLDYNRALSMFSQQQMALEAAQKSFLKTSGLSLFNFL
ncbi:MAG: flagellar hook-associated protein FlgL [Pseudomonadota bacterium]|nr:flagellar hook-associated protein FlgL [Pseudomonadota bacterium]